MKKPQLFLLHFAGGNCYSFQFLAPLLARDFEVIPLELPGRGRRIREPLLTNFDQAAEDLLLQFRERLHDGRFLIYGHSMGAYLTLRVALRLQQEGRTPACVFVSGNAGPGVREPAGRYKMPRLEFIEELRSLGGVPQELLENDELLEFFLPILRADFEIAECNGLANEEAIDAPLHALMGSEEESVERIDNWGRFTRSTFRHTVLEGGHFFIHHHPQVIADLIRQGYREATANGQRPQVASV